MFKFFKKDKKEKEIKERGIFSTLIYQNDHIKLNYRAIKLNSGDYFNSTYIDDFIKQSDYLKENYNEYIDHSNIITLFIFNSSIKLNEIFELLNANDKTDFSLKMFLNEDQKTFETFILISGSIAAYKKVIRNIYNQENKVVQRMIEELYNTNSCYFKDFIEENIMQENLFINYDNIEKKFKENRITDEIILYNIDPFEDIKNKLVQYIPDIHNDTVLDLCNITIYIFDISIISLIKLLETNYNITYEDYTKTQYQSIAFNGAEQNVNDIIINNIPYSGTLLELGNRLTESYNQLKEIGIPNNELVKYLLMGNQCNMILTLRINDIFDIIDDIENLSYKEKMLSQMILAFSKILDSLGIKNTKIENYKKYEQDLADSSITTEIIDKVRIEYEDIPDLSDLIHEDEYGNMTYDPNDFI